MYPQLFNYRAQKGALKSTFSKGKCFEKKMENEEEIKFPFKAFKVPTIYCEKNSKRSFRKEFLLKFL